MILTVFESTRLHQNISLHQIHQNIYFFQNNNKESQLLESKTDNILY